MKQIKLTHGQVALVDDADYNWLNQWKWCAYRDRSGNFYVVRSSSRKEGKRHPIYMARQILGLAFGDKRQGDHKDHNTLDNRRDNIRICTQQQNAMNQKSPVTKTSRFKGVSWKKQAKKWITQICIADKRTHLGYFIDEEMAAMAYDMVARKVFGKFAYLNFLGGE